MLSRLLFTHQFTVTVEETAPALAVKANSHSGQAIAIFGSVFDAGIHLAPALQALQFFRADPKPSCQLARINDPVTQMPKREPHGDALLQLGNTPGAEADTITAGTKIRGTITFGHLADRNGRQVRVPRFFRRVTGASGPPESDTCLGAAPQNHLTFTIAGGLMAITTDLTGWFWTGLIERIS